MHQQLFKDITKLVKNNMEVKSTKWQSIEIDKRNPIVSIFDVNGIIEVQPNDDIIKLFNPDLPWAEEHFLERVSGQPLNPGDQYKKWPYYKGIDNDSLFRPDGKFSHSYMERIWCKGYKGIRFNYGDLNDIIDRLRMDINSRQAFLSIWHPEDQSNNAERLPCTIGYWFYYQKDKLNIKFLIRSCDAIRHYRNDLYMSYRLLQFVSDKINIQPGSISYWIGSFHCFKSDLYQLNKILK